MKRTLTLMIAAITACTVFSQTAPFVSNEVINLYKGTAPGSDNATWQEHTLGQWPDRGIYDVSVPTLTVYQPEEAKRKDVAMIVCPGGGMCMLSFDNEGTEIARKLVDEGITAIILKYRLHHTSNDEGKPVSNTQEAVKATINQMTEAKKRFADKNNGADGETAEWCLEIDDQGWAQADGLEAIRYVKANASKWGIKKVGIMGFSAGAIVTLSATLHHTADSAPDFAAPIYGGWPKGFTVPADAAPLFMAAPRDDVFSTDESYRVYKAWRDAKLPAELHYFSETQHGFGSKHTGKSVDNWFRLMIDFMRDVSFLTE